MVARLPESFEKMAEDGQTSSDVHVSIIIPTLNEEENIEACLTQLRALRERYPQYVIETIVVDGGSQDRTVARATPLAHRVVTSTKGRARQMNVGATYAKGTFLLFLHCDTQFLLPASFSYSDKLSDKHSDNPLSFLDQQTAHKAQWGFYPVRLSGNHFLLRVVETMMNLRSRFTSVATGDQCLFVRRAYFLQLKGFSNIPLMEDVEFSKRLRRSSSPYIPHATVITDSRRWERFGILKTIALMWSLRALFFLGVPATTLANYYR